MGPEGGEEGGMVIAQGTPEQVAAEPISHTGEFLAELLTPAKPASAKKPRGKGAPKRKPRAREGRRLNQGRGGSRCNDGFS